jgi:hypothetical protein
MIKLVGQSKSLSAKTVGGPYTLDVAKSKYDKKLPNQPHILRRWD